MTLAVSVLIQLMTPTTKPASLNARQMEEQR